MFTQKKYILWLKKNQLIEAQLSKKGVSQIKMYQYTNDTAQDCIAHIKKEVKGNISTIIGNEYSYSFALVLNKTQPTRKQIEKHIQELIPEDLDQASWDYRIHTASTQTFVQIIVVAQHFLKDYQALLTSPVLELEPIVPESLALARTIHTTQPTLMVFGEKVHNSIYLIHQGIVIFSWMVKTIDQATLTRIVSISQSLFNMKPTLFLTNTPLHVQGFTFQTKQYNPLVGAYLIKGDRHYMQFVFNTKNEQPMISQKKQIHPSSFLTPSKYIYYGLILLIALGLLIGAIVLKDIYNNAQSLSDTPDTYNVLSTPTIIEDIPSTTISYTNVAIRVLNGNGAEGTATDIETLLDQEGYRVVETDNADNFSYSITLIRHKQSVPDVIINNLDKLLKNEYSVDTEASLSEQDDADIELIIGQPL